MAAHRDGPVNGNEQHRSATAGCSTGPRSTTRNTAYFGESFGLSNCAFPCAVLRRRKLGALASMIRLSSDSSFAEIRDLSLRDE